MSDLVSKLFDRMADIVPEVGAEMSRMGTQGAAELASALFRGEGFVPYGAGQNPTQENQPEVQQDMGMER